MPLTPKDLSKGLIASGDSQIKAGNNCIQQAEKLSALAENLKKDSRVDKDMGKLETGTRSVGALLSPIAAKIKTVSEAFHDFTIPTIRSTTKTIGIPGVGDIKFITSLTLGTTRPLATVGSALNNVAVNIEKIITALATIANGLNDIKLQLPEMQKTMVGASSDMKIGGENMIKAGTALKDTGKLLAT